MIIIYVDMKLYLKIVLGMTQLNKNAYRKVFSPRDLNKNNSYHPNYLCLHVQYVLNQLKIKIFPKICANMLM